MTTVISVPLSLDELSFEQVIEQLAAVPDEGKILIDARHVRWASPYGLTAMLCVAQSRTERMTFAVPEQTDTLSYWSRAGFFRHAGELFELHGAVPREREVRESGVLLEITPITHTEDVHGAVERIHQKAADILHGQLNLDASVTGAFGLTLSEACQNIVEHAEQGGWAAVQTYNYVRRLGRRVVVVAVTDAGIGFRRSLESSPTHYRNERWGDAAALEAAVLNAVSRHRFQDNGRGQGIAGIRRFTRRWNGKLSVRSGTARIAIIPGWDEDLPLQKSLPYFPGAQLQVVVPERLPDDGNQADQEAAVKRTRGRSSR